MWIGRQEDVGVKRVARTLEAYPWFYSFTLISADETGPFTPN